MNAGDENSARSHAVAAIWYIGYGGVICTVALLLMRSGFRTIPYLRGLRGGPIPLEMIAGIAGIVAFMGFVQIVIAIILKLRGRR
jgi:hypothetical protein